MDFTGMLKVKGIVMENKPSKKLVKEALDSEKDTIRAVVKKQVDQKINTQIDEQVAAIVDSPEFDEMLNRKIKTCINSILKEAFAVRQDALTNQLWNSPKGEKAVEVYDHLNQTVLKSDKIGAKADAFLSKGALERKINALAKHYLGTAAFENQVEKLIEPSAKIYLNKLFQKEETQKTLEELVEKNLIRLLKRTTLKVN